MNLLYKIIVPFILIIVLLYIPRTLKAQMIPGGGIYANCIAQPPDQDFYKCSASAEDVEYEDVRLDSQPSGGFSEPFSGLKITVKINQPEDTRFYYQLHNTSFINLDQDKEKGDMVVRSGYINHIIPTNLGAGDYEFHLRRYRNNRTDDETTHIYIPFKVFPSATITPNPGQTCNNCCSFDIINNDGELNIIKPNSKLWIINGKFDPPKTLDSSNVGTVLQTVIRDKTGIIVKKSSPGARIVSSGGTYLFEENLSDISNWPAIYGPYTIEVYGYWDVATNDPINPVGKVIACTKEIFPSTNGIQPTPKPTLTPTPTDSPICKSSCTTKDCDDKTNTCSKCSYCANQIKRPDLSNICNQLFPTSEPNPTRVKMRENCQNCVNPAKPTPVGIWSAIGCVPIDYGQAIQKFVFTTGVGIAGGIAFLYFLYGAFLILTSAGNPEKIEEAKQIFVSSLSGLLLIIFSIFLLRIIGVDILKIPGFK